MDPVIEDGDSDFSAETEFRGGGDEGICSPRGRCIRYLALFFMCFLGFGSYFCFDNPGALQDLITKDMMLSTTQFSYLYSFYSWPNTILCFVGGFLIDRIFGIRIGTVLYALIVFIGQLIFALGSLLDSFNVMLLGRLVFGIGGESLAVAQNYYAVLWFKGRELNMIFGLQLSFARVGSAVNFITMGHLYDLINQYFKGREALGVTLLVASITCVISFLCALFLACLDFKARSGDNGEAKKSNKEVVSITDMKDFSPAFWLITVICVAYYIAIFPFIALGKVFFIRKFGFSSSEANFANSFLYLISAVASPILGLLVDKTGWNIFWVFVSTLCTIGAHLLLTFTFLNPFIAMAILGLAYSMCASSLWPMISLVIPDYQLGTAYGIAQALQNLGLAVATMLAGMVVDSGGYLLLEMFFLAWLFVSLMASLIMWIYDIRTTGVLNMTVAQRTAYENSKATSNEDTESLLRRQSVNETEECEEVTQPQTVDQIRNRYLSRVGQMNVPGHLVRALR
ncbi:lysosomal dipeptide transporter MFSD1-like [Rhodnius prolixus]|uniref:lysosomal dipeptide transporter MFSD1-like n=1 Tax=Rhodnius prolixus TaxID=13249 RepID=UPI003D18C85D